MVEVPWHPVLENRALILAVSPRIFYLGRLGKSVFDELAHGTFRNSWGGITENSDGTVGWPNLQPPETGCGPLPGLHFGEHLKTLNWSQCRGQSGYYQWQVRGCEVIQLWKLVTFFFPMWSITQKSGLRVWGDELHHFLSPKQWGSVFVPPVPIWKAHCSCVHQWSQYRGGRHRHFQAN